MLKVKPKVILCGLFILASVAGGWFVLRPNGNEDTGKSPFKSVDTVLLSEQPEQGLVLREDETEKVFESKPVKSDIQFNAIAPHWKETNVEDENRTFEMRASLDNKDWGPWMEVEASGDQRDGAPKSDRIFAEYPIFTDGKYFQYRVSLKRSSVADASPQIYDLKINQIDSREPKKSPIQSLTSKIKGAFSDKAYAANPDFRVVPRAEWGSPDPHGHLFKDSNDLYWHPNYKPVQQVFIHHTVTPSYQNDPAAAVRALWQYHTYTQGWGDIGYNYVVDHNGTVYEGRFGGDNVVGGHTLDYNRGSMGIAIMGCFEASSTCSSLNGGNVTPSTRVLDSVASLISRKTSANEVNPAGWGNICKYDGSACLNLPTVAGHRDAYPTSCPGDFAYGKLPDIRSSAAAKNAERWMYSAKQLTYSEVDLSATAQTQITLSFKNTGAATWSKTGDKLHLMTANPTNRDTPFQGAGWRTTWNPTLLNEATVPPGGTGTFTFNIARPSNLPVGHFIDYYRLQTDSGATFGSYYGQPVRFFCTFGSAGNPRPNGAIIIDPNGATYLIDNGQKRYIESPMAAFSHGLDLAFAYQVTSGEVALLPNGPNVTVADGILMRASNSLNVYILDGPQRRLVASPEAMSAFGMRSEQVHIVSPAVIGGYSDGPVLHANSAPPDGRLIRGSTDQKVYKVENGLLRWVSSPSAFSSYGFQPDYVGTVSQSVVNGMSQSTNIWQLRTGSLITAADTPNIYVTDTVSGTTYRRWITHPNAYLDSGFHGKTVYRESRPVLNSYVEGGIVACHQ